MQNQRKGKRRQLTHRRHKALRREAIRKREPKDERDPKPIKKKTELGDLITVAIAIEADSIRVVLPTAMVAGNNGEEKRGKGSKKGS